MGGHCHGNCSTTDKVSGRRVRRWLLMVAATWILARRAQTRHSHKMKKVGGTHYLIPPSSTQRERLQQGQQRSNYGSRSNCSVMPPYGNNQSTDSGYDMRGRLSWTRHTESNEQTWPNAGRWHHKGWHKNTRQRTCLPTGKNVGAPRRQGAIGCSRKSKQPSTTDPTSPRSNLTSLYTLRKR